MAEYNEATAMQGVAERFAKAAEELRLTGRQLFRDGIVANDQVLSKIKKGWQKPTKKAIELFCQKYGVSAAWMYTGEGNQTARKRSSTTRTSSSASTIRDNQCPMAKKSIYPSRWLTTLISGVSTSTTHLHRLSCRATLSH